MPRYSNYRNLEIEIRTIMLSVSDIDKNGFISSSRTMYLDLANLSGS